jgi:hypothetical protein
MQLFTHRAQARSLRLARLASLAICAGQAGRWPCPLCARSQSDLRRPRGLTVT